MAPSEPHAIRALAHELQLQREALRHAQLALEESRDSYCQLYEIAPVGYVTLDESGKVVDANAALVSLLGVERSVLYGKFFSAFMPVSWADAFHIFLQDVFASDVKRSCNLTVHTASRGAVPVHVDAAVFVTTRAARVCRAVVIDLSELSGVQEGLRAEEARSKTLLDTAPDAVIGVDGEGRITGFNRAAESLFGYPEDAVLGKSVRLLIPFTDGKEDGCLERYLTSDMRRQRVEGRRRDGSMVAIELSVGEWSSRGEQRFTIVMHDLEGKENVERLLLESEERFREIAERISDVFFIVEEDDTVSYVSPAFEKVWGLPCAEFIGRPRGLPPLMHPDDVLAFRNMSAKRSEGDRYEIDYRICRADGELRWIHARGFPITNADGHVIRTVGVAQDITARKQLEDELRHAQKMEAVGALASGVAHDFNNVLQAVVGCASVAADEHTPPERARKLMRRAAEVAMRGGSLAKQLMTFSRKQCINAHPLGIDRVLTASQEVLARLLGEHIELTVRAGSPHAVLLADVVQIEQLLMNLASNARDAMPSGGVLEIRTQEVRLDAAMQRHHALRQAKTYVQLVVRDTGAGMDESTRARIFEPFFTTKARGQGTGLGLATVFAVTRQLGGCVEVESALGCGTTFTFHFPCCEAMHAKPAVQPLPKGSRLEGTILLVEDEPILRDAVRLCLERVGLTVVEAVSTEDARCLNAAHPHTIDLLISDVLMPGMTGPALAKLLTEARPGLRTLFISAQAKHLLIDRGTIDVDTMLLEKPFSADELTAKVAEALRTGASNSGASTGAPN